MTQPRFDRLNASLRTSELDAVILNPGPTLTYLSGLHFHLMERPVVLLFAKDQDPAIVLPELSCRKSRHCLISFISFLIRKILQSGIVRFARLCRLWAWMGSGSGSSRVNCVYWNSVMSKMARPKRTIPMRAMCCQA